MATKQTDTRQVIIKGILDISRRLLNAMDDVELRATLIRAWRTENENENENKPMRMDTMDVIDIGLLGRN